MKHIFNNLSEEEKNNILEQHTGGKKFIVENFNKLVENKLGDVKPLVNEQSSNTIITNIDKLYDYKKINGTWFAKNKKGNKWFDITKYPETIKRLELRINSVRTTQKPQIKLKPSDNINIIKGFQLFMNKNFKDWYNGGIIPHNKLGVIDNITKTYYNKYGKSYHNAIKSIKTNLPWYSWEHIKQVIGEFGEKVQKTMTNVAKDVIQGFTHYIRKAFPNVAELFFSRDLTTDDFTDSQKKIMYDAIKSAKIRNKNQKNGYIEYVDYGDGIEKEWFGPGGTKTSDMVLNTLFSNPKFMVATTLGRFTYKDIGDKIVITDNYDFKKIDDIKTTTKELEGLSYPEKIFKIKNDNNVGYYLAIRHLGYLEHPDTDLKAKPKIAIELNPQDFT